ncbi:LOW QUALITY PROTEIN: reverse transcriptase [Phytophthora megakarya]|uniref:Reverse transcriptase n=1 Tax=Phytophthora megakarya TaxID=4795 RepID=A0A225UEY0_9STRA|nr:LOW QUALITY PROTEIN: reverse transcriptase [Phytophthora megakarya]
MCIDYQLVKNFIQLSSYPLPLIDDFRFREGTLVHEPGYGQRFLDNQDDSAKLISAFVCPFGHFQWIRMPFGLKNAPLIYQQLPVGIYQEVLDYLNLDPQDDGPPGCGSPGCTGCEDDQVSRSLPTLADQMTVFKRNIPAPTQMSPGAALISMISHMAHQLGTDLDALLYRLRYWNISVSLPKSEFGKLSIPYLSHEISAVGIRATPKIAKGFQDLPFPTTLKRVQSFLGSLNYYHKFIEDYPVVAASLYELSDDQGEIYPGQNEILKHKIVSTPVLKHPDRTKPFVIIPHANQWAACAVLGQEHDGLIQPVRFTGRVLHDAELRYHIAEKEVIAVLRVLQVFRTLIQGCPLTVYLF